jgi:hypothetical protein
MAKRPTINTLTNTESTTFLTQLNQNFSNVQIQFDNTLSLDGSLPNAMNADLDMNSNDILNAKSVNTSSLLLNGVEVVPSSVVSALNITTRSSFVSANVTNPGLNLNDGQVVTAGGYEYRRQVGSTAIPDLAGWVPNEPASPLHYAVTFDGTTADTTRLNNFFSYARTEKIRTGGRTFLGEGASFNGAWGNYADYTGLSTLTRGLHNWGPRDAQIFADSSWGGLCVVGSSQASKAVNWPGYPAFTPSSIGIAGFAINDVALGQAWGGYFDCVRMPGVDAFSVSVETAMANLGDNVDTSPFTLTNGSAKSGVGLWVQSGGGLDLVGGDLAQIGLTPRDVNHAGAGQAFLSSFQQTGITAWATSTAYVVGDKREDVVSNTVWQCVTAHTSPGSGVFSSDRAANPSRWKQIPAFLRGVIFGAGSLAEIGSGNNIFSAIEMTERMQVSWYRKTGAGAVEQAANIYADTIADGTAAVSLIFKADQVFSTAKWAGTADGTYGGRVQTRGNFGANDISFQWDGTNIKFYIDNTLVKTL